MRSAVLLTSSSSRSTLDPILMQLRGKTILEHTQIKLKPYTEEILIIVHSPQQLRDFQKYAVDAQLLLNDYAETTMLTDVATGLKASKGSITITIHGLAPLVSTQILELFIDVCPGNTAVATRKPDGTILPFPSVYDTVIARDAVLKAVEARELNMDTLLEKMTHVLFFSTTALATFDPKLHSYFMVNNPSDLKRIEALFTEGKRVHDRAR